MAKYDSTPLLGELERRKPIDGAFLRKENWTLGQHSGPYESVFTTQYPSKGHAMEVNLKDQITQIKQRVGGDHVDTSTGPQEQNVLRGYFQSMTKLDHKPYGSLERIDPRKWAEARDRLSQSNFKLGN